MRDLTLLERRITQMLGDAWTLYGKLPEVHGADRAEFTQAIHAAQNIILSRPTAGWFKDDR